MSDINKSYATRLLGKLEVLSREPKTHYRRKLVFSETKQKWEKAGSFTSALCQCPAGYNAPPQVLLIYYLRNLFLTSYPVKKKYIVTPAL